VLSYRRAAAARVTFDLFLDCDHESLTFDLWPFGFIFLPRLTTATDYICTNETLTLIAQAVFLLSADTGTRAHIGYSTHNITDTTVHPVYTIRLPPTW